MLGKAIVDGLGLTNVNLNTRFDINVWLGGGSKVN
jgi:hypothetical protein